MSEEKANIPRDVLYAQIWQEPITKLASTYGVSGSYLARICRELKIPTPSRGYWARLHAGKKPPKDALPPLEVGDATMWLRSTTSARCTDSMPVPPCPHTDLPAKKPKKFSIGMLTEARPIFAKSGKHGSMYLYPRSRKIVDIVTSLDHFESSLHLAEKLYRRLDDYGYRVTIANKEYNYQITRVETDEIPKPKSGPVYGYPIWRPDLPTVAYLGTVAIGISIVEMSAEVKTQGYYPVTEKVATERYRIYAYSPYCHTNLVKSWQDTKEEKLQKRMDEIIAEMEAMAHQIPSLIIEGEKRAEEERLKREAERLEYRRKREIDIRDESEKESRTDLEKLILQWAKIRDRLGFINQLSEAIKEVDPATQVELSARLERARNLLGEQSVIDLIKEWQTPEEKFAERKSRFWY